MACCVRGYHEYKDMEAAATREVLVCGRWRAVVGKFFVVKLYSCKIFSYVFCVRKYFCNEKKANYGTCQVDESSDEELIKGVRQVTYRECDGMSGLSLRYGSTLSSVKWTAISSSPVATRTRARTNAQSFT